MLSGGFPWGRNFSGGLSWENFSLGAFDSFPMQKCLEYLGNPTLGGIDNFSVRKLLLLLFSLPDKFCTWMCSRGTVQELFLAGLVLRETFLTEGSDRE